MFYRPVIFGVLNCITDTIQVTAGRIYFPWGPVDLLFPSLGHRTCLDAVVTNNSALNSVA